VRSAESELRSERVKNKFSEEIREIRGSLRKLGGSDIARILGRHTAPGTSAGERVKNKFSEEIRGGEKQVL